MGIRVPPSRADTRWARGSTRNAYRLQNGLTKPLGHEPREVNPVLWSLRCAETHDFRARATNPQDELIFSVAAASLPDGDSANVQGSS